MYDELAPVLCFAAVLVSVGRFLLFFSCFAALFICLVHFLLLDLFLGCCI
jgi:hypothetical protein